MRGFYPFNYAIVGFLVFCALLAGNIYTEYKLGPAGTNADMEYYSSSDLDREVEKARKQMLLARVDELEKRAILTQWLVDAGKGKPLTSPESMFPGMSEEEIMDHLTILSRGLNNIMTAAGVSQELENSIIEAQDSNTKVQHNK